MKGTMVAIALLLSAGTALAQDAGKRDALDLAKVRLLECLANNAGDLDDGTSDARSVAAGVLANCGNQRLAVEAAATDYAGAKALTTQQRQEIKETHMGLATTAVLTYRRSKRAP